jgi:hypothetical protein
LLEFRDRVLGADFVTLFTLKQRLDVEAGEGFNNFAGAAAFGFWWD